MAQSRVTPLYKERNHIHESTMPSGLHWRWDELGVALELWLPILQHPASEDTTVSTLASSSPVLIIAISFSMSHSMLYSWRTDCGLQDLASLYLDKLKYKHVMHDRFHDLTYM